MPVEARLFNVTIPAGTTKASLFSSNLVMPPRIVDRIEWVVPFGPSGSMGWFLAMGGVQIVPYGQSAFVIADDDTGAWDLSGLPDSGAWQLFGYNLGAWDHTVYLRFLVDLIPPGQSSAASTFIPSSTLVGP